MWICLMSKVDSKINVCQGCYRVLLHENTTVMGITLDDSVYAIEFCLQCAGNLVLGDLNEKSLKEYSSNCKKHIKFLDPLAYRNDIHRCLLCGYMTTRTYCYECSWKVLRQSIDRLMLGEIMKYANFEEEFQEKMNTNESYLASRNFF